MSTPSMIWVLIRATEARNTFLGYVDSGSFKEAIDLKAQLDGMVTSLKSFVQQHGAGCPIACEDVVAMKIPVTLARNLESIIALYLKGIPGIAAGVGFNYSEAAAACKKSRKTRQIELYQKSNGETLERSEDPEIHKLLDDSVQLPTNLYDPTTPSDDQYKAQLKEPKVVGMPGFEKEIQAESAYIKVLATQMGSPSDQEIQQAQQQQQAMQQQQAAAGGVDQSANPNAKSMLSALGKNPPKPNNKDEDGEDKEESGKSLRDAKSGKDSSKEDDKKEEKGAKVPKSDDSEGKSSKEDDEDSEDPEDMNQKELEAEIKEAESAAKADHNQKLFDQLDRIKSDLPQIMGLAQQDPKAFKQSMQMVGKLLDVAKQVQKGEIDITDPEVLEKTRIELNLPVGSRNGAKKKVAVAGKPNAWRSMRTGQLKDEDDGSPISVREHNVKMNQKTNNGI